MWTHFTLVHKFPFVFHFPYQVNRFDVSAWSLVEAEDICATMSKPCWSQAILEACSLSLAGLLRDPNTEE